VQQDAGGDVRFGTVSISVVVLRYKTVTWTQTREFFGRKKVEAFQAAYQP
jgi:hypothetical protein